VVLALNLTKIHAEPIRKVLLPGPMPADSGAGSVWMEQRARCNDSELKVEYGSKALRVTGYVKDESVNVDFTDSPLGQLIRDPKVLGIPSIGCFGDGFSLEFSGVRLVEEDHASDTFDSMIYKKGHSVHYFSEPLQLETLKNAEGKIQVVVSALDPAPPRDFRTEVIASCSEGRYRLLIDHRAKRLFASSEGTQHFGVDLTESKMGRLAFQQRTQGRMSLSCGIRAGAVIKFDGAMAIDAAEDEKTRMTPLHFRAELDANATLASDAEPVK
jgi:hypothetical protein